MEEQGLWALFWATGLPEAWLETRQSGGEGEDALPCVNTPPPGERDGL